MTRDVLMAKTLRLALLIAAAGALLLPDPAKADQNWKSSSAVWKAMDNCTRAAQKAYPDYTPESNAKREASRQACLRSANLPGEASPPPPSPQPVQQQ
jgi:hypothetical protein